MLNIYGISLNLSLGKDDCHVNCIDKDMDVRGVGSFPKITELGKWCILCFSLSTCLCS